MALPEGTTMKSVLSVLFILILWQGSAEARYDIISVQSADLRPFEEAIKGFEHLCDADLQKITISESQGS